jgi:2,3-bisphosphoglycerate-dependent phosphoglycerate mutase
VAVSLWVGRERFEIGAPSFFKAWFSTISVRLEAGNWGSRFPTIMHDLYGGSVPHQRAETATKELESIRREFAELSTDLVVWDFEDREARPPWGDRISDHITSLANYFVTSDGRDLFDVVRRALAESTRTSQHAVVT